MHEEDGDKVQRMPVRKSTRFRVTASGEPVLVTPDSGASNCKMVQAGYAERVLRTFGMWDCNPVLTPLDPNVQDMLSMYCGLARSCRPSCASTDEEHCGMSLSWLT